MSILLFTVLNLGTSAPTEMNQKAPEEAAEVILVQGIRQRLDRQGRLTDAIEKTEVIDKETLFDRQVATLSAAVENAPGIRVNNECSICGIKRVMINGMKGEHTTILVDGVPMHSVVSSFYGMDAISVAGVDRIEIARGSGASLIAPEAMGGTLNIITKTPVINAVEADISSGENHYRNASIMATGINQKGDLSALITAQHFRQGLFDGDRNGVGESANLNNTSLSAKLLWDISFNDNLELRYAYFKSDIMGGPKDIARTQAIASFANGDTPLHQWFEIGDVGQTHLGQPWEMTEAIDTAREETTLRWLHQFNASWHSTLTYSRVSHGQDSFYEGFDYVNDDLIDYLDLRFGWVINNAHTLTFGVDQKNETMRSISLALQAMQALDPAISGDSFDHETSAFYLQDVWRISDAIEWQIAVRADRIKTAFIDQPQNGFRETLIAPRTHVKWQHNDAWTSRLSAGTGYRTPLTFFESDHGILDNGFIMDIDELEQSKNYTYALSFDQSVFAATLSFAHSKIENLAYIETENLARPTLRNSDETVAVNTIDLMWSWQINDGLSLDGGFEVFDYDEAYKASFGVIPIEQRVSLGFDFDFQGFDIVGRVVWIDARDLTPYGYADRFNQFIDGNQDGLVDAGELQSPKNTKAPAYFTVDLKVSYEFTDNMLAYIGATNLLDYNQASDEESPLFWYDEGGEAAFDVGHIWGPLRGRQVYAGIKVNF